jgi:hypothetical protein
LSEADHQRLTDGVIEIKGMLASLIRKLIADR